MSPETASITVRLPRGVIRQVDYKDGEPYAIWTVSTRDSTPGRRFFRRIWTAGQAMSIAVKCTLRAAENALSQPRIITP